MRRLWMFLLFACLPFAGPLQAADEADEGPTGAFYMGGSLDVQAVSSYDVLQLYNGSGGQTSVWWDWGFYNDLHLGYVSPWGLGLEAGYQNHNRLLEIADKHTIPGGSSTDLGGYSATTKAWYVEPLFRRAASRRVAVIGGVKLGVTDVLFNASKNGRSTFNATGSGTLISPEVRVQFLFGGRFGLELGFEWRLANAGPLTDGNGNRVQALYNGALRDWNLEGSGPAFRLGLTWYFSRLRSSQED